MQQTVVEKNTLTQISQSVQQQKDYFATGATLDVDSRIKYLKALEQELLKREDDIHQALYLDLKKSKAESYSTELGIVLVELRKAIKHLKEWARPRRVATPLFCWPAKSRILPEPYGTTLVISAWNYPFQLLFLPLIGAIAAGNTAVCKPSELSPNTTQITDEIIGAVFDPGHVTCIQGGIPESTALLAEKWDYIFFTGSPFVGGIVYQAAAKHLTPVTLELGGKSPCIVDKTANLDTAASRIIFGKYINVGQTCIAPDYLFVHEDIKEELISKMKERVNQFYGPDPQQSEDYGRMINEKNFDRVVSLIDEDKVIFGGKRERGDKYISPTFMDNVVASDKVMQDEIFGPVFPILTWKDLDEVTSFVRSNEKPLVLYMFSKSKDNIQTVLGQCSSGGACINDCLVQNANDNFPFGGVGQSGIGGYHGKHSFDTFSHLKSVLHRSSGFDIALRYAPWAKNYKKIKFLIDKTL